MKGFDRGRRTRSVGPLLDKINIVFAIGVIVSAVFLIIDKSKYEICFPILFTVSALMNLVMGYKHYKMAEMGRMIVLGVAFVILAILSAISFIAVIN